MSNDLRRPTNDPIRKAHFYEQARDLVRVDRNRRKAGMVVDTAGMITSALERAYKYGFEDAQREDPKWSGTVGESEDAIEWITIPARARRAFECIALFALGKTEQPERIFYYVPAATERGTPGWWLTSPGRPPLGPSREEAKQVVAQQTIAILLRLGLVRYIDDQNQKIVLTQRGRNTWAMPDRFHDRTRTLPF